MAQLALESSYGESEQARKGNNFFGIRVGSSWKGAKRWHEDDVPGYFRNYDSVLQSIEDHSQLVERKRAGYASAKDYVQRCENIHPILEGGKELIEHDPLHNILFSVHMYGSWNNAQDIIDKMTAAKEKQLPLIVGEFGYNYNNGQNNLTCTADHRTIMKTCQGLGAGVFE